MKIAIIGAGVSGALLGALLSKKGYDVYVYDIKKEYQKACGDAVPTEYRPSIPWNVKTRVREFVFYLDKEEKYSISYSYSKWQIIDKWEWVNRLRNQIKNFIVDDPQHTSLNKRNFDIIIDAKGPYNMDTEVVYTTRALIKVPSIFTHIEFEFESSKTGFYWIFPDEIGKNASIINVGGGFLESKINKEELIDYIKRKFKNFELIDLRGAPITLSESKNKYNKIGEARGLVFPLSGEGIRPSAISAETAFEAIEHEKDLNEYIDQKMNKFISRIKLQRLLLNLYVNIKNRDLRKSLLRVLFKRDYLLDAYLEDKIDLEGILESIRSIKYGTPI